MANSKFEIRTSPNDTPLYAWLQLTNRCNLSCSYCYTESGPKASGGELSIDQARQALDAVAGSGGRVVHLSGGEPTIWPWILDLVAYATHLGVQVGLVTNGTHLRPQLVEALSTNGAAVQVSLDAVSPDAYKKARGKDRLPMALHGIDSLLRAAIEVTLSTALTTVNQSGISDLVAYARNRGIRALHLAPSYWRDTNILGQALFIKDIYPVLHDLYELQLECFLELSIDLVEQLVIPVALGFSRSHFCNAMAGRTVEVGPDGQVFACAALRDVPKMKLGEVSPGKTLIEVVDISRREGRFPDLGGETIAECQTCEYRGICAGGCRAATYHQTGRLDAKHPHCDGLKRFIAEIYRDMESGRIEDYLEFLRASANFVESPDAMTKFF